MRRFKSYLLILVALWLPLQAAAAVTMPFCRHAAEQVPMDTVHCHEQVDASSAPAVGDFDCDNCAICHLATAGYLLATATRTISAASGSFVASLALSPASYIGDLPLQPPRRLN